MSLCHVLMDDDGATILDAGLPCDRWLVFRALRKLNIEPRSVRALILTHGHLDHAGNLAALKAWCGAPIYAHPAEQAHIDGTYPYAGTARWCGRLERTGRGLFGYQPASIDVHLSDGDVLPFWGGLEVVHLPGHTLGHCGFYSKKHRLLFSADLFASYWFKVHLPPTILNSTPELIPASLARAASIDATGFLPNHYDFRNAALHRERFRKLYSRLSHST
ncbi:MAG: MBL fold metallo-hydrolase [Nibricoccus sp.]